MSITLEFAAVIVSCSVDAPYGGAVDLLIDALAGVLIVVVIGGLPDIDVGVLVDANANVFARVMRVKFSC